MYDEDDDENDDEDDEDDCHGMTIRMRLRKNTIVELCVHDGHGRKTITTTI
jgi:hypothetical protein